MAVGELNVTEPVADGVVTLSFAPGAVPLQPVTAAPVISMVTIAAVTL